MQCKCEDSCGESEDETPVQEFFSFLLMSFRSILIKLKYIFTVPMSWGLALFCRKRGKAGERKVCNKREGMNSKCMEEWSDFYFDFWLCLGR